MAKCCCVLVTYNPDILHLKKVLRSVAVNEVELVVVDNASAKQSEIKLIVEEALGVFISLNINYGIAYAQNVGIKLGLSKGAEYIWLSDQDTVYPDRYLSNMLCFFRSCEETFNRSIGIVVPSFIDTNRAELQPVVVLKPFSKKIIPKPGTNFVSHAIASGMLIKSNVLELAGLKDERLFIDLVDFDFCWRVRLAGFDIIANGDVCIEHTLGDMFVNFLWKKISIRSPFRHYFIIRNSIYMSIYGSSTPFFYRFELLAKALAWLVVYPLLAPNNKIEHLKATLLGAFHGVCGRLGPK